MTYENKIDGGFPGGLQAAELARESATQLPAGPFDVFADGEVGESSTLSDALIAALLVVYPVVATAVAATVGMSLSGPVI